MVSDLSRAVAIGAVFCALGVPGCSTPVGERAPILTPDRGERPAAQLTRVLDLLLDDVLEFYYERDPVSVGKYVENDRLQGELPDFSPAATDRAKVKAGELLARAGRIDAEWLGDEERLNLDLVRYALETELAKAEFHPEQMPITSISGPQYWLPQLSDFVPLSSQEDRDAYLSRLRQIPRYLEDHVAQMRRGMSAGRVPPKAVIRPAVTQARSQASDEVTGDPVKSAFYRPFDGADDESTRGAEARSIIADEIAPAYAALADFLEDEYLPACRDTVGISQGIDGPAAYDAAIREYTTLPLTADEVHETGLAEVARLKAEMIETIRRTDWYTDGPATSMRFADDQAMFEAFIEYLRTDERFYFEEPEDLLDGYRAVGKKIDLELPGLFGRMPRLPWGVRPIPLFAARFSPTAYYYEGSIEDGRAGYFMANTFAMDQRPSYDMVALTLHEAVPGHHFQIAIAQEQEDVHPLRRIFGFTAFVEGWALYAERLGLEVGGGEFGLYDDPYDDFGRLNFEMWRSLRLVVDTGLHSKGWTRQQAIGYMMANSAVTELNATSEVDRYIGWPGQALGYKIGQLKIIELRERAEESLGDHFDLRDFHDAVLGDGSLPLPVLEAKMDRWVEAEGDSD